MQDSTRLANYGRRLTRIAGFMAVCIFGLALAAPADAHIAKIVIDRQKSESPAYGGKSYGSVGQYEKIYSQAYGELDPKIRGTDSSKQNKPQKAKGREIPAFCFFKSGNSGLL